MNEYILAIGTFSVAFAIGATLSLFVHILFVLLLMLSLIMIGYILT
jgi:hypothetical protein